MNRIPTEGLKLDASTPAAGSWISLNEQNPDRGIETVVAEISQVLDRGLNEQNPDRGIETIHSRRSLLVII